MQPREQHIDPDDLALVALGELAAVTDVDHLQVCARCQSELDQLKAVVHTGRTTTRFDEPQRPSDDVWARISDELGIDVTPASAGVEPEPAQASVSELAAARRTRTRRPWLLATAAAVAGVLAGGAVTAAVLDDESDAPTVVATTTLDPLDAPDASGRAEVVETSTGRALSVDVSGLPADDGFFEVWLLDSDATRLVSLGVLGDDARGSFRLPDDLDLGEFPVVDVSIEPYDGDPGHSSVSAVRGVLPA